MCSGTSFFNLHVIYLVINDSSDSIPNKECLWLRSLASFSRIESITFKRKVTVLCSKINVQRSKFKTQSSKPKLYTVSRKFLFDINLFLTGSP